MRKPEKKERRWAMGCHLVSLFSVLMPHLILGVLVSLVLWLIKRKDGAFVEDQGRESINFQLSLMVYIAGAVLLSSLVHGAILLVPLAVFALVCVVVAVVKASEGTYFRYPLIIRFIK